MMLYSINLIVVITYIYIYNDDVDVFRIFWQTSQQQVYIYIDVSMRFEENYKTVHRHGKFYHIKNELLNGSDLEENYYL